MGPRLRPQARLSEMAQRLSERDPAVLTTMRKVRLATAWQLERSTSPKPAVGNAGALAELVGKRLLARLPRSIGAGAPDPAATSMPWTECSFSCPTSHPSKCW